MGLIEKYRSPQKSIGHGFFGASRNRIFGSEKNTPISYTIALGIQPGRATPKTWAGYVGFTGDFGTYVLCVCVCID